MKASERLLEFGRARQIGEIALVLYLVAIVSALLLLLIRPNIGPLKLATVAQLSAENADGALVELELGKVRAKKSAASGVGTAALLSDPTSDSREPSSATALTASNARLPGAAYEGGSAERSFIPLDFSLPPGITDNGSLTSAPEGSIRVRKAFHVGSRPMGSLQITIDRNSRLLLDVRDLRKLMKDRGLPAGLPADGLVSFRMLRDLGVDLRYNPTEDLVSLETN